MNIVWKSQEIFRRNRQATKQNSQSLSSNPTPPQSAQGFQFFCHFFLFFKQLFLTLTNTKKTLSQSQPPPSFRSALTSLVHTQKRLPQPTIGLPLLNENDVEEIIGVCEAFLAHKTQASSQFQQVLFILFYFILFCFALILFLSFLISLIWI